MFYQSENHGVRDFGVRKTRPHELSVTAPRNWPNKAPLAKDCKSTKSTEYVQSIRIIYCLYAKCPYDLLLYMQSVSPLPGMRTLAAHWSSHRDENDDIYFFCQKLNKSTYAPTPIPEQQHELFHFWLASLDLVVAENPGEMTWYRRVPWYICTRT